VLARLGRLPAEEVDRAQPEPGVRVIRLLRMRPQQVAEGLAQLAELVMRPPELLDRARVVRLEAEDVAVLEDGVAAPSAGSGLALRHW